MLKVEVDIGFRPVTLPLMTQAAMVYYWVSHFILVPLIKMFMEMRE